MMGAVTGFVQIQNDPHGVALEWDPRNPAYWKSRFKALGWATAYSTSYELAPWGEAGIGNVGYDRGTMGYVDLVVTPIGGFAMLLLEDYLDAQVIKKLEQGKSSRRARLLRIILNPQRSLANLLRFERPSHRDTRTTSTLALAPITFHTNPYTSVVRERDAIHAPGERFEILEVEPIQPHGEAEESERRRSGHERRVKPGGR
jgi:hypothetical protein